MWVAAAAACAVEGTQMMKTEGDQTNAGNIEVMCAGEDGEGGASVVVVVVVVVGDKSVHLPTLNAAAPHICTSPWLDHHSPAGWLLGSTHKLSQSVPSLSSSAS